MEEREARRAEDMERERREKEEEDQRQREEQEQRQREEQEQQQQRMAREAGDEKKKEAEARRASWESTAITDKFGRNSFVHHGSTFSLLESQFSTLNTSQPPMVMRMQVTKDRKVTPVVAYTVTSGPHPTAKAPYSIELPSSRDVRQRKIAVYILYPVASISFDSL
ncbi:unnamed protein product [Vitrella brassicaformis CCMP3155]|uniref:Uncharacterized protein n=1 Tax=Vitrella brassicaformis (strain CCMP3155) TaxID=1169540 RepID=A0A0G4FJA5_VITBC|nr:unnamed protein product [Vitrella brassicaformis CCMP3155]|eukprot:CEM13147.1 unnamed protein product [Vitrella brassicaformis CCMP3155]